MSRPLVRFVQCDACEARVEHAQGLTTSFTTNAAQWIPPGWAEIFDRTSGTADETRHVCTKCKVEVLAVIEVIKKRLSTMISPELWSPDKVVR